jgi:hypothetical protein
VHQFVDRFEHEQLVQFLEEEVLLLHELHEIEVLSVEPRYLLPLLVGVIELELLVVLVGRVFAERRNKS